MHALRHVHRLLVPNGTLVDLHPVTEEQVEDDGRVIGVIEEPNFVSVALPNAEACLQAAIRDGLYTLEAETEFDVLQHYDEIEDLLQAQQQDLAAQPELVRRIRALAAPPVLRERCVLRRLRACV